MKLIKYISWVFMLSILSFCFNPIFIREKVKDYSSEEVAATAELEYFVPEGEVNLDTENNTRVDYEIKSFKKSTFTISLNLTDAEYKKVRIGWETRAPLFVAVLLNIAFPPILPFTLYNVWQGLDENGKNYRIKDMEIRKRIITSADDISIKDFKKNGKANNYYICHVIYSSDKYGYENVSDYSLDFQTMEILKEEGKKNIIKGKLRCPIYRTSTNLGDIKKAQMMLVPINHINTFSTKIKDYSLQTEKNQASFEEESAANFEEKSKAVIEYEKFLQRSKGVVTERKDSLPKLKYHGSRLSDGYLIFDQNKPFQEILSFDMSIKAVNSMASRFERQTSSSAERQYNRDFCNRWIDEMPRSAVPKNETDFPRVCSKLWKSDSDDHTKCVKTWKNCIQYY